MTSLLPARGDLQSSPSARRGRRADRGPLLLAVVGAGYLLWQLLLAPTATWYPDTARYAAAAWELQGVPAAEAEQRAAALLCADRAEQTARRHAAQTLPLTPPPDVAGVEAGCRAALVEHLEPTADPRYGAIFDTRQGYPAAVAVLEPLAGMTGALWVVAAGATLLAGAAVAGLLVAAGAGWRAAAVGQLVVYAGPAGWWGAQLLTEGPVLAGVAVAWWGWVLCARGRWRIGSPVLAAGLLVVVAVKYSTALPVAAGLALAALLSVRHGHRVGLVVAGTLSAAAAAAIWTVSQRLGWPGWRDTVQDLLTVHYALPDVPDPGRALVEANLAYWPAWPGLAPVNALLVAALLAGGWALWRWWPPLAWSAAVMVGSAVALTAAHPDVLEGDRLYVVAWLAAAAGAAAAARGVGSVTGHDDGPRPEAGRGPSCDRSAC